jgi:hypothetical protein
VGQHELDQMLAERDRLNADVQRILDEQTDAWGIKVSNVELKHIDLDGNMVRAIARQAEAERLRRAKVIDAEGELQAAEKLVLAGEAMARSPESPARRLPPSSFRCPSTCSASCAARGERRLDRGQGRCGGHGYLGPYNLREAICVRFSSLSTIRPLPSLPRPWLLPWRGRPEPRFAA